MKLNGNNRGGMAMKTMFILLLLAYGTFAGYSLLMTKFTKSSIDQKAADMITKIKAPSVYSDEEAEELLIMVLKNNDVYESDKLNPVFSEKTEDGRWVDYELTYRIRTNLLLFKTDWEKITIKARSDVSKRN